VDQAPARIRCNDLPPTLGQPILWLLEKDCGAELPTLRTRGWSVYGAQQAQPVATTGKWAARGNRGNKPNLLPWRW
jgi:hypothetical protein